MPDQARTAAPPRNGVYGQPWKLVNRHGFPVTAMEEGVRAGGAGVEGRADAVPAGGLRQQPVLLSRAAAEDSVRNSVCGGHACGATRVWGHTWESANGSPTAQGPTLLEEGFNLEFRSLQTGICRLECRIAAGLEAWLRKRTGRSPSGEYAGISSIPNCAVARPNCVGLFRSTLLPPPPSRRHHDWKCRTLQPSCRVRHSPTRCIASSTGTVRSDAAAPGARRCRTPPSAGTSAGRCPAIAPPPAPADVLSLSRRHPRTPCPASPAASRLAHANAFRLPNQATVNRALSTATAYYCGAPVARYAGGTGGGSVLPAAGRCCRPPPVKRLERIEPEAGVYRGHGFP